jgi:mannan polymerase II complex ANP1 subunit
MEEMEKEKSDKAAKEKADIEKIEKIKSQFHNPSSQWEKDKTTFQDIAVQAGKLYSEKIARKSAEMHPQKGAGPGASKSDKVKAAPADQV